MSQLNEVPTWRTSSRSQGQGGGDCVEVAVVIGEEPV
ncbi:DUF397 domain-containing protein [Actinoallomurus acanthiterrae]